MSATPEKKPRVQSTFSSDESLILVQAMASKIMSSRSDLYATPGLEAHKGHGGNAINRKVMSILKDLVIAHGGDKDWVADESKRLFQGTKGGSKSPLKKRKAE